MDLTLWLILLFGIIWGIPMIFIQYKYIGALEKTQNYLKLTQSELYEKMPIAEEQLHYHIQSHFITGSIAYIIYKIAHKKVYKSF